MPYQYITSRGKSALEDAGNGLAALFIILLIIAIVVGLAYVSFWLFVWAVATLFNYHIAFTFINWVAYVVLTWSFGRGSSSSSDKK